jgi:hypothetical protein
MAGNEDTARTLASAPTPVPTPEYAPPGVFYLLTTVRKDTKDGIIRLLPGTAVKLIRNGRYSTPEGEMTLDPKVLTNDLTQARAARNADLAGQTAAYAKNATAPQPAVPAKVQTAGVTYQTTAVKQAADGDAKVRAISFRLSVLRHEEERLAANVAYLEEKAARPFSRTQAAPAGLGGSTSLLDYDNVSAKLADVRAEIQTLEASLQFVGN